MEHNQEHVATLCAVGTVGIAAAGLALGMSDGESYLIKPGKRKAPGSSAATQSPSSPEIPYPPRPQTSQPSQTPPALSERIERRLSASLLRRKTFHANAPSAIESTGANSRESSVSRHGILRPWTSDRDSSTERKDGRPGSSWLRRISSMSRGKPGSPASSSSRLDESPQASRPSFNDLDQPNKLVKRSSSRRMLHSDRETHASETPALLRRPATSHQRSATLSGPPYTRPLTTESVLDAESSRYLSQAPAWRPFFDSGYARKRYSSGGQRESYVRTVSAPQHPPTLLMGNSVTPRETEDLADDRPVPFSDPVVPSGTRRHKMRRPLASMRRGLSQRHFTDPIVRVSKHEAYGSIVPPSGFPGLSPVSNVSGFEVDLPVGTPQFTSSPPSYGPPQHRFSVPKRMSVAPSDPTTASSDNDTRVFTDDDSMDFHSDTAYDSLATRATASSHSGFRQPKIETIFDEMSVDQQPVQTNGLEYLMQKATLDDSPSSPGEGIEHNTNRGIGISGIHDHETTKGVSPDQASTPVKDPLAETEDSVSTPVPKKSKRNGPILNSSPPSIGSFLRARHEEPELPQMMDVDEEDIEWSPKSDDNKLELRSSPLSGQLQAALDQPLDHDFDEPPSTKRSSIFDWSEHQKLGSDQSDGVSPRPKTVHGKHGNNLARSRASGRKSNAAMHLRSQSVPVNRDSLAEADLPSSASKFGTWALGNKPVSEEWSDDFEFDDAEENEEIVEVPSDDRAKNREALRSSVRVPQAIIDRQQSVHIQFGQVREFMLLVEELKRLRVRGIDLGLVRSHSRQLWEDAVSIIDLATLNDEEDNAARPSSPVSSDIFGDETPPQRRVEDEGEKRELGRTVNRRSISSPGTPPYGRPRGESFQTKNFLQTIHQSRNGIESSPTQQSREKLPFDTQDLKDLVVRAGVITRALKEIVRKAEGVNVSPEKPALKFQDPIFRQIFDPPDASPSPGFKKPSLPKSRSANSYLDGAGGAPDHELSSPLSFTKVVEAN
ncbi:hypothetical protein LTR99_002370 [Exophiala xenobiotica]|uniref:Uncharacterized protein n=1 Tax=Vermiconidia calcicola TaxID=1690605 RepID=A0AAV9QJC2_9PEZI|nr:hypothetical protein LTR92_004786 [Exophiala xenobiotica]KAK5541556.1 hypothetical protein LTR23_005878 [Chaetothyriales sp. CCFEE 6169]KAK5542292.1 hypothetical protein LTR25_002177 [Vermiconidia calcicola]KAK5225849.1 hypothetical protein LTR72_003752 [Exophiala xenobiotica]KAK5236138.1 hypothetical protein LTR47_002864 [Exophiala xenobiotica]